MHEYLIHLWNASEPRRQQKSSAIACKNFHVYGDGLKICYQIIIYVPTYSLFEAYLIMEPTSSESDHSSQAVAELSTQASPGLGATVSGNQVWL